MAAKYYKNINQLYLNQFNDIPEFNILKNYRLKLMNDESYVNDLLMSLNINGNYTNDINILIERIDVLIYCVLIYELAKYKEYENEFNGLIFNYSSLKLKPKIKQYEPINLKLLKKYNIFKIFDYFKNEGINLNDEQLVIDLISDFDKFNSKNNNLDDASLKTKINKYCILKFISEN